MAQTIRRINEPQHIVFPALTGVSNDHVITITQEMLPALIWATGLSGADSIPIKLTPDNGVTREAWFQTGAAVTLNATNKGEAINTPMTIVIDKPATAMAVAVYLNLGIHC